MNEQNEKRVTVNEEVADEFEKNDPIKWNNGETEINKKKLPENVPVEKAITEQKKVITKL